MLFITVTKNMFNTVTVNMKVIIPEIDIKRNDSFGIY